MVLVGPLGTPLGLSQWKRASSRVEAGTSGFLSNSDSDRSVPAELRQANRIGDNYGEKIIRIAYKGRIYKMANEC